MPNPDTSQAELAVRPGALRDIPDVVAMIGELAAYHGDEATVSEADLERDVFGPQPWADLLVAETGGKLVGYTILWRLFRGTDGRRVLGMDHLYVGDGHRGTGVGRRLVEAVIARARALGCSHVGVGTATTNELAQGFYRAIGFVPTPPPGPRFRFNLPAP